jgi:hypothetical protein
MSIEQRIWAAPTASPEKEPKQEAGLESKSSAIEAVLAEPLRDPLYSEKLTEEERALTKRLATRGLERMYDDIHESQQSRGFHSLEHPGDVLQGTLATFTSIERTNPGTISSKDLVLATAASAGHDCVIYAEETPEGGIRRARGFTPEDVQQLLPVEFKERVVTRGGGNEFLSAESMKEIYREENPLASEEDLARLGAMIGATYPTISFTAVDEFERMSSIPIPMKNYLQANADGSYPALFMIGQRLEQADLAALAVAFGDLSYHGLMSAAEAQKRADEEFKEINPGIESSLQTPFDSLTSERKAQIAGALIGWIQGQVVFVGTQALRFQSQLTSHPAIAALPNAADARTALAERFSHFEENVTAAMARADTALEQKALLTSPDSYEGSQRADADERLKTLARSFGYTV